MVCTCMGSTSLGGGGGYSPGIRQMLGEHGDLGFWMQGLLCNRSGSGLDLYLKQYAVPVNDAYGLCRALHKQK